MYVCSYSQEKDDSISIFRSQGNIPEFDGYENWKDYENSIFPPSSADFDDSNWEDNTKLYGTIIQNKIDSIMMENKNLFRQKICDKLVIRFTINRAGKIDSCRIKESINNEIDSLVLNTICNLNFKRAAIYFDGTPYPLHCSLPIQFHNCLPIDRKKKNSINKTQ